MLPNHNRFVACVMAASFAIAPATFSYASDETKDQVAENFLQADADESGTLDRREFKKLIDLNARYDIGRAQMVQRLNRYNTAFSRIDADSDGIVTKEELSAMAAQAQ